jgi:hypothetical protein
MELSQVGSRKKRRAGRAGVGCSGQKKKEKRKKEKEAADLRWAAGVGRKKSLAGAILTEKRNNPDLVFKVLKSFLFFGF